MRGVRKMEVIPLSNVVGRREGWGFESCLHLKHGGISTFKAFLSFPNNPSQGQDEKDFKRMNCTNTRYTITLARGTAMFLDSWLNFQWRTRVPFGQVHGNQLQPSSEYEAGA